LEEATKELFVSSKIFTKEGILLEKNIHKWWGIHTKKCIK
jgi:hypothetical protein